MATKPTPLSEQLRRAILDAPMSRYAISQATGVHEAALSRFVNGQAGLSLDSIDKIGGYLGLRIVSGSTPPRRQPRKKGK